MKILLTGATGFVGKHLLPKLIEAGHDVDTHLWNIRNKKPDLVIHLAAVTHISLDFDGKLFDTNIVLASEVFSLPCRIIYASSCSAKYLTNPYSYTKRYCEYLGRQHYDAVGLRFHNIYGPNNNKGIVKFLMDQPNGGRINIRGPELVRDYVHVEDVICYIMDVMNLLFVQNRIMDVGTGIGTQTMDLVNLYQKVSGKRFDITVSEAGENEPKHMVANSSIKNLISLEDGLLKTINHV